MNFVVKIIPGTPAARELSALQPSIRQAFWATVQRIQPALNCWKNQIAPGQVFQEVITIESFVISFTVNFLFADSPDENTLLVSHLIVTQA